MTGTVEWEGQESGHLAYGAPVYFIELMIAFEDVRENLKGRS